MMAAFLYKRKQKIFLLISIYMKTETLSLAAQFFAEARALDIYTDIRFLRRGFTNEEEMLASMLDDCVSEEEIQGCREYVAYVVAQAKR